MKKYNELSRLEKLEMLKTSIIECMDEGLNLGDMVDRVEAEIRKERTGKRIEFMRKYREKYGENTVYLFKLSEVYRAYNEDADKLADAIGLIKHNDEMDGCTFVEFSSYRLDQILPAIIRKGFRVAICDDIK